MPKGKKKSGGGGGGGNVGEFKRPRPLRTEGTRRHPRVNPRLDSSKTLYICPVPGTNVDRDHMIEFDFQVQGGFYSFSPNPIYMSMLVKIDNPLFPTPPAADDSSGSSDSNPAPDAAAKTAADIAAAAAAAGDDSQCVVKKKTRENNDKKFKHYYPSGGFTGRYLNPLLGASSYFRTAQVELNGEEIGGEMGTMQNVYQVLNRQFCTKSLRKKYTGKEEELLPAGLPCYMKKKPGHILASSMLNFGGTDKRENARAYGYRFAMDGCFLLSSTPKNLTVLSTMSEKGMKDPDVRHGFTLLRPGTNVNIKFFKNDPISMNIGNFFSHPKYSTADNITEDKKKYKDAEVTILEMCLLVEVHEFAGGLRESKIFGKVQTYTRDIFKTEMNSLPPEQRTCQMTFRIRAGTKVAYLLFPFDFQIYYDPSTGKGREYCWRFPSNLEKLSLKLDGKNLKFGDGLTNLSAKASNAKRIYATRDSLMWYNDMISSGVIDNTYEEMVPPDSTTETWKDVVVMEFIEDEVLTDKSLTLDLIFEGPKFSPKRRMVLLMSVLEEDVVDRAGKWSSKIVSGRK